MAIKNPDQVLAAMVELIHERLAEATANGASLIKRLSDEED